MNDSDDALQIGIEKTPLRDGETVKRNKNIVYATMGECVLIVILGTIGWVARMPLIFPSLGPTAYEQVEKPNTPSAKLYNVVVGHLLALGAGFLSLWILHAWHAPIVLNAGFVSTARLGAATLAVVITVISTLALKANQPASLATSLLVSLGGMQKGRDAVAIIIAVFLLAAIGEPIRRVFAKEGVGR